MTKPPTRIVGARRYGFGMRIGRMTACTNLANLLSQASTEMAKASACYRRADDEPPGQHQRAAREEGLGQAKLGIRFLFEFLLDEDEDLAQVVADYLETRDE